jgi:zinc transport system substrate-binding protein
MSKKKLVIIMAIVLLISVALGLFVNQLQANRRQEKQNTTENIKTLINSSDVNSSLTNSSQMPTIAVSFYPLEYMAKQIVGNRAMVFNPVSSGTDMHDFEPTSQDIKKITESKLFVYMGNGIDPWAKKISQNVPKSISLSGDKLSKEENHANEDDHKESNDSHTWLSISEYKKMTKSLSDNLSINDPQNADFYTQNSIALDQRLTSLDQKFRANLSNCKTKTIFTTHNAFGYLAKDYGLKSEAISVTKEPTIQELTKILNTIQNDGTKAIFYDPNEDSKLANSLIVQSQIQALPLSTLESRNADQEKNDFDFIKIMEDNLQNLSVGLQCQ